MARKKIAINATIVSSLEKMDGFNRYTIALLENLVKREERIITYTTVKEIKNLYAEKAKFIPLPSLNNGIPFLGYGDSRNLLRFLWHQINLPISLKQENISLFYSTTSEGMLLPVCSQVITVHDITPLLFPEFHPRYKYYYQWILPNLIKASKAIIAISESTKRDIEKYYKVYDKPIHVVYQGYREDTFHTVPAEQVRKIKNNYNLIDFILCVGETRPYKNVRRLIEAFAKAALPSLELVVVGKLHYLDQDLIGFPKELGIADKVKFLGYVSDEDLVALYNGAKSFVFPSLYEGFGIPPLEAMACGCPVIVSQIASLPEVCGNAAYYVDPYSTDSIAKGIYKVATDERLQTTLREKGLERVKNFSYSKAAEKTLEIMELVTNESAN